jgi:hypothetical protein
MNFGTTDGLNREGDKIMMLKKSVEESINTQNNNFSLNKVFYGFKTTNKNKISTAKKNRKNNLEKNKMKNNSPWGF